MSCDDISPDISFHPRETLKTDFLRHSLHSTSTTMASVFIVNSYQINFDSVLMIPDHDGMLNMFKALEASGLRGFLGCESVLYEMDLEQFFDTALVQGDDITGDISGKYFSISPARFAQTFELPTDGLVNFSEPWTATASLIIDLLSDAHSKSLEDLLAQQKEHSLPMEQPCASTMFDYSVGSGAVLARFYSVAKSTCWLLQHARQDNERKGFTQVMHINDLKKGMLAQVGPVFQDLMDIKKSQREQDAKITALDRQVAAIRSEQLEFQAKIAAHLLSLSTQIGDLVDYIRGGDATKGEGSSSRPQPPPSNVQGQGSGGNPGEGSGPTVVRLTDIKIAAHLLSLSTQIGDLVDYIRGGDATKGEGSSSRPQPPPSNVQGQGSGGNPGEDSGPTVVRLTDIVDRIRQDDRRQMEAERERERQRRIRRLSSRSHKRRRGY
ncbi:hypothetical protein F511_38351 [Dorcoceras hygrometricum]|uniref:Uncharacterized protein n=1 Tax=Dorcoceras hygrometricum TaxID=472368 RepID=A0A2Z7D618_9LAMI|nr:hypothetical protein F511_38351 [Dorcoceras hygrometricum]